VEISIGKSTKTFKPQPVNSLYDLSEIITKTNWSCGLFKDNHRNIENFISSQFMALDIDDSVSIEEAARRLKPYSHIIAPSKSHKKEKNGAIADRYRAVVVLDKTIDNSDDYYSTYAELMKLFPEADKACKDPSRFFYPSQEVYSIQQGKKKFSVKQHEVKKKEGVALTKTGQLSGPTLDLLLFGAEAGTRHGRLYKAAKDALENGYSIESFTDMISEMAARTGNWTGTQANDDDIKTIKEAFDSDPRHAPREVHGPTFKFQSISELRKNKNKMQWIVDGLFTKGGLSVFVGAPKSGKSTIIRQLAKCVARGEKFLNRKTKQGRVLMLSLEEQIEVLNIQFKQLGVTKDDDILVHVGSIQGDAASEDLAIACKELQPQLIIIDTLMLFVKSQNINDYTEMNKKLEQLRILARSTGAHVICIHHQNKSRDNIGAGTILGSAAIHGAVDAAVIFNKNGHRRFIQSTQRAGKPLNNEVIFTPDTQTYVLGKPGTGYGEEF